MARIDTLINFLTDVAAAIKTKKGDTTDIPAANFDTEIENLPSGDNSVLKSMIERTATSVEIPNDVTAIGDYAFCGYKSLESITIPDSVTSIGYGAFSKCESLASITIPSSVESIGDNAFYDCRSLLEVDFSAHTSIPSIGYQTFWGVPNACTIKVPSSLLDEWKSATFWSELDCNFVGV